MIQEEEEDQTAKGVQEEEGEVDPNSKSNDIDELSVVIQQECRICKDFVSPVADITLGCNCVLHANCLVHCIRMRLGDRRSLMRAMKDSLIKGVKCPYANIQPELNECKYSNLENSLFYFITPEQMMELNIVDSATTNADPQLLKIEEIEKLRRWIDDPDDSKIPSQIPNPTEKKADAENLTIAYINATTKACPTCGFRGTHFQGHSCHHISPYGGCINCSTHYCYCCLSTDKENSRLRGANNRCKCVQGTWTTFCGPLISSEAVEKYLKITPAIPYPHDIRCGCVICPDCTTSRPCASCPGTCAVCLGFVKPGPATLGDEYKIAFNGEQVEITGIFKRLLSSCMHGYARSLEGELSTAAKRPEIKLADLANRVDNSGRTMLHYACHGNSEKFHQTVKILLETFPNINFSLRDMYGKTAMDYALSVNAVNTAMTITTKLGNIDELLLKSCKLKLRDLIKFIIQEIRLRGQTDERYGLYFVANIKDENLRTPLHIICDNPSPFISRSETWNIFLRIPWVQSFMATYLEMGDSQGNTPLHLACCLTHYDNLEVIDFLSSLLGADWTAKNKLGDTPLHALCKLKNQDYCRKNPKKLRSILTNYNVNLFLANAEGDTFLHFDAVLDYLLPVFDESEESLAYSDYDEKYSCLDWDACFRILNGKRQSILFTTVISGNLSLSKRLLELNNRGLSATDYLGNNLLHYSCSQSVAMMKIVLAHCGEAELTAVNLSGQTPMHVLFDRVKKRELAEDEEIEIMDLLFQNKDDWIGSLSVQDVNGCTPLHYLASVTLRVAWLMALIPVVPKHCMVLQDNQGQTILHVCCKNDNMDFLNPSYEHFSLLAPAIGIPDAQGNTPIHCVSLLGGDETLRNLCLLVESSHTVFNSQNADGITPLMCCLKRMNSASVLRLLSYQSLDSLSAYDKNGNTALHYACEYNMETAVGLVLEAGAFLSSLGNSDADLPIHVAARKRNVEIFFKLLPVTASHNKVEPVITNAKKENVLHMVTGWKVSYVAAVLDQINVHDAIMQQNIAGDTPLHCAIRLSHVDSVQLLLKHYEHEGESIVLTNDMGRNIFHVACANFAETDGDIESKLSVLRLVLQFVRRFPAMLSRAVDSLDACGETPCHYLLTSGNEAALLLLLECCGASCDLSLKNKDDLSIFDKAFLAKNTSIIALMVEFAAQDCAQFGSIDSELLLTYACNDCSDQRLLIALICHTSFPIDKIIADGEAIPAFEFLCSRPDLAISLKKYLTSGRRNTIDFATSFIQGIPLIEYIFDGMNRLPLACIILECRPEILQYTVPGSQPPTTVLDMLFSDAKKIRFAMSLVERGLVSTASCNVADIRAHLLDASNCEYKTAMQFLACVSEETKKRFIESSSAFNGMSVLHELCAHHVRTQTDLHKLSATAEHEPLRSLHSQRLQSCNNFIREIVSSNSRVVNFQDSEGSTALHIIMSAIEKASSASPVLNQLSCDVAHLLIHSGADLTLRNSSGDSPVHLAFRFDCKDFIPLFSEKGFDFASVNASGQTVLHIACEYCFSDSIEKLVSMLSVDVISAGDCDGSTALHTVCRQGKDRLAKLIIAKIGEEIAFTLRNLKNQSPAEVGSKYKDIKKLFAKKK